MKKLIGLWVVGGFLVCCLVGSLQAKTLTVGCDINFMPFEFKQGDSYVGFDIDLWDAVAKELGVDYTIKPMNFDKLIPGLQTGNIDVALAGMTINAKREKLVDFSYPYFDAGLQIMVRHDTKNINSLLDLKGKVVATKAGTTSADFVKAIKLSGVGAGNSPTYHTKEMKLLTDIRDAYKALSDGSADAVVFDSPVLLYSINNEGKGKFKTVGPLYKRQTYGIAFQPKSELRERVSITLLKLFEDGTYNKIYKKWFGYLKDTVY